MKKFLGTRIGVIAICLVACMIVFGGFTAYAATLNKTVPVNVTFKASAADITLYTDYTMAEEFTTWNLGTPDSGVPQTINIYVKNTGNKTITGFEVTSNLDPVIGTVTFTGNQPLLKGQGTPIHITINTNELLTDYTPDPPLEINIGGIY